MQTNNKLREACANIAEYARSAMCHTTDAHVLGYLNQIEGWAKAALAEPVKNCDTKEPIDSIVKRFKEENCDQYDNALDDPRTQCHQNCVECIIKWMMANRIKEETK